MKTASLTSRRHAPSLSALATGTIVMLLAFALPASAQQSVLNDGPGNKVISGADLSVPNSSSALFGSVGGTTLSLNYDNYSVGNGATLTFGDINHTGTVVFNGNGGSVFTGPRPTVTIAYGTLQIGTASFPAGLFNSVSQITVDAGAIFDVTNTGAIARNLQGGGEIKLGVFEQEIFNDFEIRGGSFSGVISGADGSVSINGGITVLSGNNTYTGKTGIYAGTLRVGNSGTSGSIAGDVQNFAALVFDRSDTSTYDGVISGDGSLTKEGMGRLVLTGFHDYSGVTTVSVGTLEVNGALSESSAVTVKGGAALAGGGDLGAVLLEEGSTLTIGATDMVGVLSTTEVTWNADATIVFDLATGGVSDLLTIDGTLKKGANGLYAFTFLDKGWELNQVYTLATFGSTDFDAGDFSFTNGGGFNGVFGYANNSLTFSLMAVPEASTWMLLVVGVGLLFGFQCVGKSKKARDGNLL